LELKLPPVAVQVTPGPLVVAAMERVCVTVRAPRLGETVTAIGPEALMVRLRFTDCLLLAESVTWKVSGVFEAGWVGVPVIAPVEAFSDKPAGKVPLVRDHVYGVVPPVAARVALYAALTWPLGSDVVVITSVPPEVVTVRNVELAHPVDGPGTEGSAHEFAELK
jgi:hypothetical protein